jgi:hypothetical protein
MWLATDSDSLYPVLIEIETPHKQWFYGDAPRSTATSPTRKANSPSGGRGSAGEATRRPSSTPARSRLTSGQRLSAGRGPGHRHPAGGPQRLGHPLS